MKKLIKRITLLIASTGFILVPVMLPITAHAVSSDDALCSGADLTVPTSGACSNIGTDASSTVQDNVKLAINIFSWIVGVAAVIMIMVGGMMYVTSSGDSTKVGRAKDTILYAIIGLVVVAIAQVIVKFVLSKVT